jgi:hypothetical protein
MSVRVLPEAAALFRASVRITIGDGAHTLFWEDPWIGGLCAGTVAPAILQLVKPRFRSKMTVQQGLQNNSWATVIEGELSVDAVVQYLRLWEAVSTCLRQPGNDDCFRWKWTSDGGFTARSAYLAFFQGTTAMSGATNIWESFVPMAYRMHAWLALRRRCWTADRRLRRGLHSHVLCPMCTTADETIDHLSVGCVFGHRVWAGVNRRLGFTLPVPSQDVSLADWWTSTVAHLPSGRRKDGNSIIMLVIRSIWLERNARVFEGKASPSDVVLDMVVDTWCAWMAARGRQPRGVS